jgi:hypothetical protein
MYYSRPAYPQPRPSKSKSETQKRTSKKIFVIIIVISLLILIPSIYAGVKYMEVENSPVGKYYHYDYSVQVTPENNTDYVIYIPTIVYAVGGELDKELIDVDGNVNWNLIDTEYGRAAELAGSGGVVLNADWEFDAINEADDYKSDGGPGLSMLNETKGYWYENELWVYADTENITININFDIFYKSWHIKENRFHDGYTRGGGGHDDDCKLRTKFGWNRYLIERHELMVE